jgi:hypothetical protein
VASSFVIPKILLSKCNSRWRISLCRAPADVRTEARKARYSWDAVTDSYEKLFRELIRDGDVRLM